MKQILIPHMETKNGPYASVGDVNGDQLQDIFIGASKGEVGHLSIQQKNGRLTATNIDLSEDRALEDMGSILVDIDNDKDLDLYIVSGGSQEVEGSDDYQDRLYINEEGIFKKSTQTLPRSNGSIVVRIDINKDGYSDLFVGGRMQGMKYPYPGTSHVLINNKGKLEEMQSFEYKKMGMVTSATVLDINKDGWEDLIVVGEWMQPTFLINEQGKLVDRTSKWLPESNVGWWFEIEKGDIDGDGVMELLLGNIGMNNKYHASPDHPLKVYSADFDKNNTNDIVLAKQTVYGEVPVRGRECSSQQLPFIKNKYKTYDGFAHAEVVDILGKTNIASSLVLEATNFQSGYLKLFGEGQEAHYEFIPFPRLAQISAVQGIEVLDVNKDGHMDIVVVGNHFDAEVETVRHDASYGLVMLGTDNGRFETLLPIESGFDAGSNAKDLKQIVLHGNPHLVVTNNSYWTQVFELISRNNSKK